MLIEFSPIGEVHVNVKDEEVEKSVLGVDGIVEVYPQYENGLKYLDEFSYIILIAYLHKINKEKRKTLRVKIMRLLRFGVDIELFPEVGVFCTNSPCRQTQ